MPDTLLLVLLLLAASVVAVAFCRRLRLPPILGYLIVGIALGPHALAVVPNDEETRELAEFGIVFLMFSIGLEFSLPQLRAMRRAVFGLGAAQVAITAVAGAIVVASSGLRLGRGRRAGRRARDELDGDRVEDARRARGARDRARARRHGRPAVPGPRGRRSSWS